MTHALKLDPGLPASVALHGLLLIAVLSMTAPSALMVPEPPAIAVELVAMPQPVRPQAPAPPTPNVPPAAIPRQPPPAPERLSPAPTPPPRDAMVKAERFYSASVLADPRSAPARRALATFAPDERIIQLCNIEVMEQIHRWKDELKPDLVVPYAMANLRVAGGSIHAEGAAFRANRRWHRVKFDCDVVNGAVAAFQFSVGDAIPEALWDEHNLVVGDPED